jgi:hypothetical protein
MQQAICAKRHVPCCLSHGHLSHVACCMPELCCLFRRQHIRQLEAHAICNMQPATCNMQPATCRMCTNVLTRTKQGGPCTHRCTQRVKPRRTGRPAWPRALHTITTARPHRLITDTATSWQWRVKLCATNRLRCAAASAPQWSTVAWYCAEGAHGIMVRGRMTSSPKGRMTSSPKGRLTSPRRVALVSHHDGK